MQINFQVISRNSTYAAVERFMFTVLKLIYLMTNIFSISCPHFPGSRAFLPAFSLTLKTHIASMKHRRRRKYVKRTTYLRQSASMGISIDDGYASHYTGSSKRARYILTISST